ncbi:MAG: hypothetical protein AB7E85_07645 [Pseudobdellovibrionaceae bacterium]
MRIGKYDLSDAYAPETGIRDTYDKTMMPTWMLVAIGATGLAVSSIAAEAATYFWPKDTAAQPSVTYIDVAPE